MSDIIALEAKYPMQKKKSRGFRRWHWSRRVVQVAILSLFLYLLLKTTWGNSAPLSESLFFRLDPLAGISAMLASRSWMAPMALGLVVLLLTVVFARFWCGWICPLGTILDWLPSRHGSRTGSDIYSYWRHVKYFLLLAILLAAIFGSLTLMVFDPISIVYRTVSSAILPGLDVVITKVEEWLYHFNVFQSPVEWFDDRARGVILNDQPFLALSLILAGFFVAILALNAIISRFWCRNLCPLGGLLALVSKFSFIKHRVDAEKCISCKRCANICPTGAIDPSNRFAANMTECITCIECVETCPVKAVSFGWEWGLPQPQPYDPSRRQFLYTSAMAVAGVAVLRIAPLFNWPRKNHLRPPGSIEDRLLSDCIRCGECIKVCPTGVIQPSYSGAAGEALWTPKLRMRSAFCDYACNACGQVCPTGAIQRLTLAEKRKVVIGHAHIDQQRCFAWAEARECVVCVEMCPIPEKAIKQEWKQDNAHTGTASVPVPRVVEDLCIGCGHCEYQCPVEGESAIRVLSA